MREVARIDSRALNSDSSVNPGLYGLGFSHDDAKLVVLYVAGLDNYRSMPSKGRSFLIYFGVANGSGR